MKTFKYLLVGVVSALSLLSAAPVIASADTAASSTCTVKSVGTKDTTGNPDSRFTLNSDGTVSASFTVTGSDCNLAVTIASWQAPNAQKGQPYSEQKLFAQMPGTFAEGTHNLTIGVPDCFYQVDLIRGSNATGPNGSAVYDQGVLMGSLHGGTKTCTPVTPPTPPTTPPTLPNTGAGSNAFIVAGVVSVIGYLGFYLRKQRVSA